VKVLIFTTQFYLLSGAERLAIELAEELNKMGIHTDILSMYTEDLPGVAEKKKELIRNGIPNVHFLGMKIHPSITSLIPAIIKLRRLLRGNGYDIVETSQVSPTVIASWATRKIRTHHIAGIHQVFRRENDNSMKYIFWRYTVRYNMQTRFYAISDFVADSWIRYSAIAPKRTRRVYNAIPDACFKTCEDRSGICDEFGISTNSRLVLFVGRLDTLKGIDLILHALGPLLEQENLVLLYAGHEDLLAKGTKKMLANMKQTISDASWGNRVKFLGRREDVPRLLASCDILVHPTRKEGFGLVLVEAMAAGLPVVASNVEGIPEVLAGTDSIMVIPNDPDALRDSALKMLKWTDKERAIAIEKGKRRAENFRIRNRTAEMICFMADVIGSQSL
jgi:glycosyltransferase involved in cell wall biosynthesis